MIKEQTNTSSNSGENSAVSPTLKGLKRPEDWVNLHRAVREEIASITSKETSSD